MQVWRSFASLGRLVSACSCFATRLEVTITKSQEELGLIQQPWGRLTTALPPDPQTLEIRSQALNKLKEPIYLYLSSNDIMSITPNIFEHYWLKQAQGAADLHRCQRLVLAAYERK